MEYKKTNSKAVPLFFRGKFYSSKKELADALELTHHHFETIFRGYSNEDIEMKEVSPLVDLYFTGKKSYFLFNKGFLTLNSIAEHFGLSSKAVTSLHFRVGDNREVFEEKLLGLICSEPLFYKGNEYGTLALLCSSHNQDYTVAVRLLRRGYSLEEVMEYEVKQINGWEIEFNRKKYPSKRVMYNSFGYSLTFGVSIRQYFPDDNELDIFNLYLSFLRKNGCEPSKGMITGIPMVYYNGDYYLRAIDFYKEIGVTSRNVCHEVENKDNKGLSKEAIVKNMGSKLNKITGEKRFANANIKQGDTLIFIRDRFLEYVEALKNGNMEKEA